MIRNIHLFLIKTSYVKDITSAIEILFLLLKIHNFKQLPGHNKSQPTNFEERCNEANE